MTVRCCNCKPFFASREVATSLADGEGDIVVPGVCCELWRMYQRRKIGSIKRRYLNTRCSRGSINFRYRQPSRFFLEATKLENDTYTKGKGV
jgi:hypothetical protein